jgi:4'-phosphopantetheinyl transferase
MRREHRVEIWWSRIERHSGRYLETGLTQEERQEASGFVSPTAHLHYAAGRCLRRLALSSITGTPASLLAFHADAAGRPFLAHPPSDFDFNIAHSGELVACVVSGFGRVGVDVEQTGRSVEIERLSSRHFSHDEHRSLMRRSHDNRREHFLILWTLKEAYLKALGVGLRRDPATFSFDVDGDEIAIRDHLDPDVGARWTFLRVALLDGYTAALCMPRVGDPEGSLVKVESALIIDTQSRSE